MRYAIGIVLAIVFVCGLVECVQIVHRNTDYAESAGTEGDALPFSPQGYDTAFIEPDLPQAGADGLPPIDKASLIAYAREGIRAHGPLRRNCHKIRHGLPLAAEIVPPVQARTLPPPVAPGEPQLVSYEPTIAEPVILPPDVADTPEFDAYLPPRRELYGGGYAYVSAPPVSVPEPGTLALFAIGLAGLAVRRRSA